MQAGGVRTGRTHAAIRQPTTAMYEIALLLHILAATIWTGGHIVLFAFAIDARLRVLPHLSADWLTAMAWHIVPVTILSILLVVAGVSFRTGWLS